MVLKTRSSFLINVRLKFAPALCADCSEIRNSEPVAVYVCNINVVAVRADVFGDVLNGKRLLDVADFNVKIKVPHLFLDGQDLRDHGAEIAKPQFVGDQLLLFLGKGFDRFNDSEFLPLSVSV